MSARPVMRERLGGCLLPILAGGLAFLLYASTAAPWLTWANDGADGGDLIAAAMTWGVPHPSGYPTYCLLARAYALLPLGPVARRFNLFSATMAAAAVTLVYLCALSLLRRSPTRPMLLDVAISLGASLAFATGPTIWSQATITEVYALHTFFFALCLYLVLRDDLMTRRPYWGLLGLALGLGLGVHLTLALALPGLALLVWPQAKWRRLLALLGGMTLGLGVYAYLPLAARGSSPVLWGDPRTWGGAWWIISGKPYHHYLFGLPLPYLPSRVGAWARLWAQQYTWAGLALAMIGLWSWLENKRRNLALATLLMFALHTVYAVTYDTTDSYVYLIPNYVLTALWMAEGVGTIMAGLLETRCRSAPVYVGALLIVLAALPLWPLFSRYDWSLFSRYDALDLSEDRTVAQWAEEAFGRLPEGAVLITGEDRHTFALDYLRWVEGSRPDLLVVDGELLHQAWYRTQLVRRYPWLTELEELSSLEGFILANLGRRAVFLSSSRETLEALYEIAPRGPLWEIIGERDGDQDTL